MSSPELEPVETIQTGQEKLRSGEVLLLAGSVLSLILGCIFWSAHKQGWMDEIFTWKEVNDPSLWHLYWAIQHGADGGQPLFYTTVWLWARAFGSSFLSLRLYSCAAMCAALVVTWTTLRRSYGMWATAFGVLCVWCTSGLMLDQNAEGRFYGLYVLAVAITVAVYARLTERQEPSWGLLAAAFFSQAALVLTHVLGIFYGGLILVALIIFDLSRKWFRPKVYLAYAAGWLALLTWIPAIRASMAAGTPQGWILPPHLRDLPGAYGLEMGWQLLVWLRSHWPRIFPPAIYHLPELFVGAVLLASAYLWWSRRGDGARSTGTARGGTALVLLAFVMFAAPCVLFLLSLAVTPVLVPRYVLPDSIGLAILLACLAEALGDHLPRPGKLLHFARGTAIGLLLIFPIVSFVAIDDLSTKSYLDVQRVERDLPPDAVVVVEWQHDFSRMMRFSPRPTRFFYLLDWNTALHGPRGLILDYHLMRSFRQAGYFASNIEDQNTFFCSHPNFYVLNRDQWFETTIGKMPQFAWKRIDILDDSFERDLYSVHEIAPFPFCKTVEPTPQSGQDREGAP
ncbi:MAG TPA: glycosyltransferase family 39 protein [Acidobacteriaceae bacterium]|nr:glycosyltransferase family 39 protein [Acidobacteriaceae bacterium]